MHSSGPISRDHAGNEHHFIGVFLLQSGEDNSFFAPKKTEPRVYSE